MKNVMKKFKGISTLLFTGLLTTSALANNQQEQESLENIAYDAFTYAYPMMEQVKTINGMFSFMGLKANQVSMNPKLPSENVGMPIVAPNLTSMTGGIFIDISHGPVTLEIPEVKDRYVVYQNVDVFTHNFNYMGTLGNNGDAGKFIYYHAGQILPETDATPVLMEGDHAIIIVRIDIKDESELARVHEIQQQIRVIDAPKENRDYPSYDTEKAQSPAFVEYLNELLIEIPPQEKELFERFAEIGVLSEVVLNKHQKAKVQAGIDKAFTDIKNESANLEIGNGYVGATEVFGTREFLQGNYLARATGAHFGLWGNSKEEANYFMLTTAGEGTITFNKDELPPLTEMGFWSITVHDENVHVNHNEYDSYVLTTEQLKFEKDGSVTITISSEQQASNWLYTPGGEMIILIRAYQADPNKVGDYIPPVFIPFS
jgi:hypothetical protein